jgi:putative MATE family efflux protein
MRTFLRLLLTALRGSEANFTSGSINRAIFLLSVPMILEMVMEALFAIVDILFVARVGAEAVATVGLTESVLTLVYSLGVGFSIAATGLVARRIGENAPTEASKAVGQAIFLSVSVAIVLGTLGVVFGSQLLQLMGGEAHLVQTGVGYTRVIFASAPAIILLHTLSGCLRGAGEAATAMRSLMLANGLNIVLCPLFIFGWGPFPELGLVGSAVATTIGRSVGVLYQLYALAGPKGKLQLSWATLVPDGGIIRTLLGLAAGSIGQFLIGSASWVVLTRFVSEFGTDVVAGYTVAIRIFIFSILPSWGMANAAATLVGQNLGAGQPDRAETSAWRAALCNLFFLLPLGLLLYAWAGPLVSVFTKEVPVATIAVQCLRVFCFGYVFMAYGMVLTQALNGAGDTRSPIFINILCFWLIQIPLAWLLANGLHWGPPGVFWAVAIAESMTAVVAWLVFRRGRWRLVTV